MDSLFSQILSLLTTPPGNLAYHAVLAFSLFGALQSALNPCHARDDSVAGREVLGLSLLLAVQILFFLSSGLAWQGLADAHKLLPPLDRGVEMLGLLIILWLWAFPKKARLADAAAALLSLLVIALTVFVLIWWQTKDPGIYYNGSLADVAGELTALGFILVGVIILATRRPNGWGYGLAMMVLLFVGHLAHWLFPTPESDFAGAVRLAEMAAYPLLMVLPLRTFGEVGTLAPSSQLKTTLPSRSGMDAKVLRAFLNLAVESEPKKFYQELTRNISQFMVADICLLSLPQDGSGNLVLLVGYNLIQDAPFEGFTLESQQAPLVTSALRRTYPSRLPSSNKSPDNSSLAKALNVAHAGHVLVAPIVQGEQTPVMGIVLLTPYSKRNWSVEDQNSLASMCEVLAPLVINMQQVAQTKADLEKALEKSGLSQADVNQIMDERESLFSRVQTLKDQVSEEHARVSEEQARADEEHARAESLASLIASLETAQGTANLTEKNPETTSTDAGVAGAIRAQDIASIAQELRRPVSSIIGYTDMILDESVGILGAMQRKFLERVKASTERMGGLLDELIEATALDSSGQELHPQTVDLTTVIDEALAGMIAQLSEKNISLRVDLPDEMLPIRADKDALQQVLSNLLKNAGAVTPANGEIWLRARVEKRENEPTYVLVQVTDSGGGIPTEEMPRVFSRLYRVDNTHIQGVGETGVGLSIVKALVELHGGRIWVDSEMGRGATFSLLLPVFEQQLSGLSAGGAEL